MIREENSKEPERKDSDKLDELAELLRRLDRRRGLSVQQVLGLLIGSLLLVFLVGPITVIFLGTVIGPIFASVFIAMLVMFIFEDMRSSNITKRSKYEEDADVEDQESLDEFEESKADE